jgi:hypothetical protein
VYDRVTPDRQLLLVAGSGRSGTSVLSTVLGRLGYRVPKPEVAADQTNPYGFGESQWVVDFHTDLLRRVKVHTTDARPTAWFKTAQVGLDARVRSEVEAFLAREFAAAPYLLVKDPRLLWFVPLWEAAALALGASVGFVTMLRYPADVVKSKDEWYGSTGATALTAGWVNTMLHTERATRGRPRAFVLFDDLIADWSGTVGGIDAAVGLPPIHEAGSQDLARADQLVDPNLRRSQGTWDALAVPGPLQELTERVWKTLLSLVIGSGDPARDGDLDALRDEYRDFYGAAEAICESSILAARREGLGRGAERAALNGGRASLALRIARLVPARYRHRIPLARRQALLERLR